MHLIFKTSTHHVYLTSSTQIRADNTHFSVPGSKLFILRFDVELTVNSAFIANIFMSSKPEGNGNATLYLPWIQKPNIIANFLLLNYQIQTDFMMTLAIDHEMHLKFCLAKK